ncbi:MAG: Crp/Fnr family transcriptional regulator [Bacteroidia bacterium]|nr:Crp/Fnr family transcriptional regulator [Bacteroidia bacterium]
MSFIPFDSKCFKKLKEKFQYLFDEELINEFCQFGQLKDFESDELLIDIGDQITHMPLVLNGSIKIMTEDDDENELLLYYLELGDTCAVTMSCCTKKTKSTIRAFAETDTEILFVPVDKMDEWMVKYKSWRTYVLDSYNERLNEMLAALDNIVFHSMEERIKKYVEDKVWVAKSKMLKISHADIANDLHTSRVVVSRIMKKLEQEGIIKQHRGAIQILNV